MAEKKSWLERNISLPIQTDPRAEKENTITHLVGIAFAIVATVLVATSLGEMPNLALKVGSLVYCFTIILLYLASSLYHSLPNGDVKRLIRVVDHSNIYILIAGSYTPILLYINNSKTSLICLTLWIICIFGILFSLFFMGKMRAVHTTLYIGMGWIVVFFWNDIMTKIPILLPYYIIAGGLAYSLGVIFFTDKRIPHYHAIWHIFVLAGTLIHFIGFMKYLF